MVPASTQKLLTATAALEVLDPQSRFRTTAVAAAAPAGGVVAGDLTLVGGGDPLLAHRRLRRRGSGASRSSSPTSTALAAAIVDGRRAADRRSRSSATSAATTPTRYVRAGRSGTSTRTPIGPLSALAVNDGFATYPTAGDRDVELEPAAEPAVEAAAVLTRLLEARGVDVVGEPARRRGARRGPSSSAAVESAPLVDVVGQLLQESDNNTGRAAPQGARAARPATPTTAGGAAVVDRRRGGPRDAAGRSTAPGSRSTTGSPASSSSTCSSGPAPAR